MKRRYVIPVILVVLLGAAGVLAKDAKETKHEKKAGDSDEIILDEFVAVPLDEEIDIIADVPPGDEGFVWVPGSWDYTLDGWNWVAGRWEVPPEPTATWIDGYWKWQDSKWHWVDSHWAIANSGPGLVIDEAIPIPAKLHETKPPKPSDKNHWVAGYWDWNGAWFWIPGRWTEEPHPKAEWVDGHWQENMVTDTWTWIGGHWAVT